MKQRKGTPLNLPIMQSYKKKPAKKAVRPNLRW
jgi:hypothetical protein